MSDPISTATRFRWMVATMLFFAAALNHIDRAALPVVASMITKELHIDAAHLGLIFSIFFVGYAVSTIARLAEHPDKQFADPVAHFGA